jgi:hypothetical protein
MRCGLSCVAVKPFHHHVLECPSASSTDLARVRQYTPTGIKQIIT